MSKKKSQTKQKGEEPMPKGWLQGRKEIANYMGISLRTFLEFHKKHRLPIQSLPGMKYEKLVALPSDLDEWLRKQNK